MNITMYMQLFRFTATRPVWCQLVAIADDAADGIAVASVYITYS
jgi:hypothetical protein